MRNIYYEKTINEDYDVKHLTIMDFIKICDMLKLPVFEVKITYNPFSEYERNVETKIYASMSEYRKTMPDWSARHYDYERDRADYCLEYPEIANGCFEIRDSNNHASYIWNFEVVGECVVVHQIYSITD